MTEIFRKVFLRRKAVAGQSAGPPVGRLLVKEDDGGWYAKPVSDGQMECYPKLMYERVAWSPSEQRWRPDD